MDGSSPAMAATAPAPLATPPGGLAVSPIPQYVVRRPPAAAAPPSPPRLGEAEEEVFYYQEEARPPSGGGAGAAEVVLYGLLILAVILVLFFALVPRSRVYGGRREKLPLAEELAFAGWILYGRLGCPWCARQLEALGTNEYPKLVTCQGDRAEYTGALADGDIPLLCKNAKAFPLWVNATTGATRTGFQSAVQLGHMARYPSSTSSPGS